MAVRSGRLVSGLVWVSSVVRCLCRVDSVRGNTILMFCSGRGNECRQGQKGVGILGIFQGGSVVRYRGAKSCLDVGVVVVRRGQVVARCLLVHRCWMQGWHVRWAVLDGKLLRQ